MQIAILMFDGFTALDAIGPYDTLGRLPEAEVHWVAAEPGLKSTEQSWPVKIEESRSLADVPKPEIVVGLRSGLAGWRHAFDAMHEGDVIKSVLLPSM